MLSEAVALDQWVSLGMILPQGTLGDVWGHLWSSPLGAPGIEWVGPGRLLHTPQRPGRPRTENDGPQRSLVLKLKHPGLQQLLSNLKVRTRLLGIVRK